MLVVKMFFSKLFFCQADVDDGEAKVRRRHRDRMFRRPHPDDPPPASQQAGKRPRLVPDAPDGKLVHGYDSRPEGERPTFAADKTTPLTIG